MYILTKWHSIRMCEFMCIIKVRIFADETDCVRDWTITAVHDKCSIQVISLKIEKQIKNECVSINTA